jgi:hypothetical protein
MSLREAIMAILTDPGRKSLYSGSQLVELVRARGVELPLDSREAWELVSRVRVEVELELFRGKRAARLHGLSWIPVVGDDEKPDAVIECDKPFSLVVRYAGGEMRRVEALKGERLYFVVVDLPSSAAACMEVVE